MSNGKIADIKNVVMQLQDSHVLLPWHVFRKGATLEIDDLVWGDGMDDFFERTSDTDRTKSIRRLKTPTGRDNIDAQTLDRLLEDFFAKVANYLFYNTEEPAEALSRDDIIVFLDMPTNGFQQRFTLGSNASDDIIISYNVETLINTKKNSGHEFILAQISGLGGSRGDMITGNKNRI